MNILNWIFESRSIRRFGARTVALLFIPLLTLPIEGRGQVDEDSIFVDARYAASALDLRLFAIEKAWDLEFAAPPTREATSPRSLMAKVSLSITLRCSGENTIIARGTIMNHEEFLRLSASERKKLLRDTVELLITRLRSEVSFVPDTSDLIAKSRITSEHIRLFVAFNQIRENTRGESIVLKMPPDNYEGQAAFAAGVYHYSDHYFVRLQATDTKAAPGDPTVFIVEPE